EVDPLLLAEPWPEPLPESAKVRLGKGLIWRMMDDGTPIYDRKLSLDEVRHRIDACWKPYHERLQAAIRETHAACGQVWHINCHSMPSVAAKFATDKPGLVHPDFVLGDRDGETAAPAFREFVAAFLRERGYSVSINDPYKGVEIVRQCGNPAEGRHSLQVEINRKLYMDEITLRPNEGFDRLRRDLADLTVEMLRWVRGQLAQGCCRSTTTASGIGSRRWPGSPTPNGHGRVAPSRRCTSSRGNGWPRACGKRACRLRWMPPATWSGVGKAGARYLP